MAELPPREEGEGADLKRQIEVLEREILWLETVVAILAEREKFGYPFIADTEIEAGDAPSFERVRDEDNEGWIIKPI